MITEIIKVVDTLSEAKDVDREVIFEAIEAALASVTARRYSEEVNVRVSIDRTSGEYESFRCWEVVENEEEVEIPGQQIPMTLAQSEYNDQALEVGDAIEEPIESVEFGRIAAQQAKQVIIQKVREAERERPPRVTHEGHEIGPKYWH